MMTTPGMACLGQLAGQCAHGQGVYHVSCGVRPSRASRLFVLRVSCRGKFAGFAGKLFCSR